MTTSPKPEVGDTPPSPITLRKIQNATLQGAANMLGMAEIPRSEAIHKLTPAQEKQLREIEEQAIANFQGDVNLLEAALGMLRVGHHLGWKVLYLIHSKKTIRNYEDILGVQIRDIFPDTGPSAQRSLGLTLALKFSNFWKVVSGEIKIPRRKDIT